jgi:A/G-specific adenine glycosylase
VISAQDVQKFRPVLLRWYRRHRRDLPWRQTRDPYAILISEVMLQQTQVATVLPFFHEWLRRFPTFAALANSSESDVLHAWQGLGYYRRALNLRAAAKRIVAEHAGRCPTNTVELRTLPGIGRYTANAIATFAFDRSVPIVEVNSARVLARLFSLHLPIDSAAGLNALWNFAGHLVPRRGAATFNSALMDLGALVCRTTPDCRVCPVKKFCRARNPTLLPIKKARPRLRKLIETHAFARRRGRVLLEQSTGRWREMWILPPARMRSASSVMLHTSTFPFTHHQVTLRVFKQTASVTRRSRQRWFPIGKLNSIPIPSPHRRALVTLLAN